MDLSNINISNNIWKVSRPTGLFSINQGVDAFQYSKVSSSRSIIIFGDLSETYRRPIGEVSETHRRTIGDPSEMHWRPTCRLETHRRPICLIGDPSKTDMPHWRLTCLIGDPLWTNMPHWRPICLIGDPYADRRPIKDGNTSSETKRNTYLTQGCLR